ncbi:MAG: YdcF family protein [Gallionella sp.]|nr:YdcF family protein [Gallionella sp.]MDD4947486.1 YdcF family protein [Gallionella sp.]MDD5611537.1 YdcF family protein [Gallionella sp.]
MSWFFTNLLSAFLQPPLSFLLMMLAGLLLIRRKPKLARGLLLSSFLLLWLASTPYIAEGALHLLESRTAALREPLSGTAAIVILGGGTNYSAPEYGNLDSPSDLTLMRLRYGARLQRISHLPILVTGGMPQGNETSEAQQMRAALEQDFQATVRWTEDRSNNTFENARYSFQTLQQQGISKIYLVTHAWHMPRSATAFRSAGFEVIEAPTAFTTRHHTGLQTFMPNAEALRNSKHFFHEIIGLLWYQAKLALSH